MLDKVLYNIGDFFGMNSNYRHILPEQLLRQKISEKGSLADDISKLLIYDYIDPNLQIFFHNNGHVGFFFELAPLIGSSADLEKNISLFINDELPLGTHLQFLMLASHDTKDMLDLWESGRQDGGDALLEMTKYRRAFMEHHSKDFKQNDGRLARSYRLFVSYSSKTNKVAETTTFQDKLESFFRSQNMQPRRAGVKDLMRLGRELLQMHIASESLLEYSALNNLSNQVVDNLCFMDVEDEQIQHDNNDYASRMFYAEQSPSSFSLSAMNGLLGSEYRGIPARFAVMYCLSRSLNKAREESIIKKGERVLAASKKSYTQDDLNVHDEASQWRHVVGRFKKGEHFVVDSLLVLVSTKREHLAIAESDLKSIYNSLDWKMKAADKIHLPCMLSMMPMTLSTYASMLDYFKISKIALSSEVVHKLPIQGEWQGVPKSGVLFISRNGQVFNYNPFYRVGGGGNFNGLVMAPPGSGKSFFLQELAKSVKAEIFVLDIGGSYSEVCENFSGEMIRFNKDNDLSLNPFALLTDSGATYAQALELMRKGKTIEEISRITLLDKEMIGRLVKLKGLGKGELDEEQIEIFEIENADGSKNFVSKDALIYAKSIITMMCDAKEDARMQGLIEKIIIKGIKTHRKNLDIDKLCELFRAEGGDVAKLADTLYSYTSEGLHGRFFKAGNSASFKSGFTVFEFEEIKEDPPLMSVVIQIILMQINAQYLCGDRSRNFMIIVDEAWLILDFVANFLEKFMRLVRKYGGSVFVCTQDLGSFMKGPAQKAVYECATWTLLLQQSDKGLKEFANHDVYKEHIPLIKSVRKCSNNKFSEVLIWSNGIRVVGRLCTDPYAVAMYSTESEDYNYLKKLEKNGVPIPQGVKRLAFEKYGLSKYAQREESSNQQQLYEVENV